MSKFSKGDIVDVQWFNEGTTRGIVFEPWSKNIDRALGFLKVGVFLLEEGFIGHFTEPEIELAMDEYEFSAVCVDLDDYEQTMIGSSYYTGERWGTLEEAENLIKEEMGAPDYEDWKDGYQFQINRRRKAGNTVGYKTFR